MKVMSNSRRFGSNIVKVFRGWVLATQDKESEEEDLEKEEMKVGLMGVRPWWIMLKNGAVMLCFYTLTRSSVMLELYELSP